MPSGVSQPSTRTCHRVARRQRLRRTVSPRLARGRRRPSWPTRSGSRTPEAGATRRNPARRRSKGPRPRAHQRLPLGGQGSSEMHDGCGDPAREGRHAGHTRRQAVLESRAEGTVMQPCRAATFDTPKDRSRIRRHQRLRAPRVQASCAPRRPIDGVPHLTAIDVSRPSRG